MSRWKELKVLRAVNGDRFDFKGIKFQDYPNLRKIVVSKQLYGAVSRHWYGEHFNGFPTNSPKWFYSSEVCLDPQVVNSLQSLMESKILSPDLVQVLTLDLASIDVQGMYKLLTDLSRG